VNQSNESEIEEGGSLVLVDGNSLLYRAFFALPPLTNAEGEVTNAAYGFTTMLLKVLDEEQPDMVAVAFDLPGPTFRHELFEDYKATRRAMPDELSPQFDMVREILDALHIPSFVLEGFEADDIIGALASRAAEAGDRVLIVTGDLDELQLVSDRISVMVTRRGITDTKLYDPDAVRERYGLDPDQMADFRALRGDASDNIPGVPGIGEKTATKLLIQFGSLEGVLDHLDQVEPDRIAGAIEAHADMARRAKKLSLIVRDLPIEFDSERLRRRNPDENRLAEIFRRLDFRSLLRRIETPGATATVGVEHSVITSSKEAESLAKRLRNVEEVTLLAFAEGESPLVAALLGLGLAADGEVAIVLGNDQELKFLLEPFKAVLESPDVRKVGHDLKRTALLLSCRGIEVSGFDFDTMLAGYLISPGRRVDDLGAIMSDYLETECPAIVSKGEIDTAAAAVSLQHVQRLKDVLGERLTRMGIDNLLRELEMPLIPILVEMEQAGVAVDSEALSELSGRLGARAADLEKDIHTLAGEEFNIGSPAQLRRILFEKLGLPPDKTKRTKSGYSTAAGVLAGLTDYEVVSKILEYREVTKLKSTYVDALPPLVNPRTGRIHTSFNQAVTATGRLSSTNPNLQNIPIRTEAGTEIRRAFIAGEPDCVLLSADYSQIELRILAHISQDENLMEIFRRDEDLHSAAAVEIFGVSPDDVTSKMRSFAKMVNFGIPYGISDFRLAREMGVSIDEARRYMARYFQRFPKVHDYVKTIPEQARSLGYVETLMGRRRALPELQSRAPQLRQAAERMAINTPMQGSAADIIKLAMLKVRESIPKKKLGGKMILQVHDELVLEVPESEAEQTASVVERCMATAYELTIPLKVDVKVGRNWLDMTPMK